MTPAVGSIAWWGGSKGYHVAWVEAVSGDTVTIEDYNHYISGTSGPTDGAYHEYTITAGTPSGYIHFKDIPAATKPSAPIVNAPSETDDCDFIPVTWSCADPGTGGLAQYQYAVGSPQDPTSLRSWTSAGTATQLAIRGLSMEPGDIYFISVRAMNGAGLWSAAGGKSIQVATTPFGADMGGPVGDVAIGDAGDSFVALFAPVSYLSVPVGTMTAPRTFTTTSPGLVAIRYLYTVASPGYVRCYVDDQHLRSRNAENSGGNGTRTGTDYVFLPAGTHTLKFEAAGGATTIRGVSAGIDTRYTALFAPVSYLSVPAGTMTAPKTFTTTSPGLVAIRYLYTVASPGYVRCYVDDQHLRSRTAGNSGGNGTRTGTDYVFLPAGTHTLKFEAAGGATTIRGVSAGIDTRYTSLFAAFSPGTLAADTATTPKTFTTTSSGLVAIRYLYTVDSTNRVRCYVDGQHLRSRTAGTSGGAGTHTGTDYVFLSAGTHTLKFETAGTATTIRGVSAGIDTRHTSLFAAFSPGTLAADTATTPKTFTTTSSGLVAIRYLYTVDSTNRVRCYVDDQHLRSRTAGTSGGAGTHTGTDYVFLPAGTHTLKFETAGTATTIRGVSAGIDTRYTSLFALTSYGSVPAGTTTAAKTFTTASPGLVAIHYLYTLTDTGYVRCYVDDQHLRSRTAGNSGGAGTHTGTDYVFLPAGTHALKFEAVGAATTIRGVSAGIDTRYTALFAPVSYLSVPAGTMTAPKTFTTTSPGLVAIRYLYSVASPGYVRCYVDDQHLRSHNAENSGGNGTRTGTDYVFLPAGIHTLKFEAAGGATTIRGVSAGLTRSTPSPMPVVSVAGSNRFETAVAASKRAYPNGTEVVIIATGLNWPDALGGTSLAGVVDGPILLVDTKAIPSAVVTEIGRLKAKRAIILGGTSAVGTQVESELKNRLGATNVERIAGSDRYRTADAVALRTIGLLGKDYDGTAFVATGGNFPDALAAAPLAAARRWPLFLANPKTGLSSSTRAAMKDVKNVIMLGSTSAVSSATEDALKSKYGSGHVVRLAGSDRYKTAIAVAAHAKNKLGFSFNRLGITTGLNFPDALAGGVLQGNVGSVLLLTGPSELNQSTAAALTANKVDVGSVTFFGGTSAVSQRVRDQVNAALR